MSLSVAGHGDAIGKAEQDMNPRTRFAVARPAHRRAAAFAAVLLAAGALTAFATAEQPQATSGSEEPAELPVHTIALAWVANVEYAPYYIAEQDGLWEAEGFATEITAGGPNAPTGIQLVTSGKADFATANNIYDVVVANQGGADLVILGAGLQRPMQSIISPADAPIKSLKDLEGKTVGVQATAAGALLQSAMTAQGLDPNSVEFVTVGTDAAALADGAVDAFVGYAANHPVLLKARGFDTYVLSWGDIGFPDYGDVAIVDRAFLEANRDLVVGYMRGLVQGYELNAEDPAVGAALAVDVYGVDLGLELDHQIAVNKIFIEAAQSDLTREKGLMWIDLDRVRDEVYPGFKTAGTLDPATLPDPKTFIDLSVLEEAFGGKTTISG